MNDNLILMTDSYKQSHAVQYPENTQQVYSYFESRGGLYPRTVFFGLQYIIDRYLSKPITRDNIEEAAEICKLHFGTDKMFNRIGWEYILDSYDGYLPLKIKAVPEGSVIPTHNVLMTVENTDPNIPWLTNFVETILSQVWYPITVATTSFHVRQCILDYLDKTGDPDAIDFKLHDFGFRGVSSGESAAIGGAAHLTSFMGTDTIPALMFLREYYGADMAGFSVPASEHSTMTSWGRAKEVDAFKNMITQYGDMPIYSVVSDSYDLFHAAGELWGTILKDDVLNAGGTLVIRPDSGEPAPTVIKLLDILEKKFGSEYNEKRHKVLNPKVRVIWGDGLEPKTIENILYKMRINNWSADNIVFGMGGGLLQKVNRDTQRFAFKASSAVVNGERRDVYKQPATDAGKNSKRGRLKLASMEFGPGYSTVAEDNENFEDVMQTVYLDGEVKIRYTLDEIRARVSSCRVNTNTNVELIAK